MATPPAAHSVRRLYRSRDARLISGVAAGLSDHLGLDVLVLRILFVAGIALGGLGVLLYAAFWVVVPQAPAGMESGRRAKPAPRSQLIGFAAFAVAMLLIAQVLGVGASVLWPAAATVTGAAILWRQADESSRSRWRAAAGRPRAILHRPGGRNVLRYLVGAALVLTGMGTFLAAHDAFPQARRALLPVFVVVAGFTLVVGPWLLRYWREAADERTARIREHERVELAARIHDSMLQTLTLIQRRAGDPDEVRRLVRHSERELREWLYRPTQRQASLRGLVGAACAEVEDEYAVSVDQVVVGELPVNADVEAMVQAMREAAVNAAKHSGTDHISVYVEVGADALTMFVRDRGPGFDVDAIPDDRFGVRESVIARARRHGGDATIRSSKRTGTEVCLTLPLQAKAPV
jgi:signal transduction histidine kinase